MSNHLGDTNKMVGEDHLPYIVQNVRDTPRTDARIEYDDTNIDDVRNFARKLERELNATKHHINRLYEAGDKMADLLRWQSRLDRITSPSASEWRKAKEDKP